MIRIVAGLFCTMASLACAVGALVYVFWRLWSDGVADLKGFAMIASVSGCFTLAAAILLPSPFLPPKN